MKMHSYLKSSTRSSIGRHVSEYLWMSGFNRCRSATLQAAWDRTYGSRSDCSGEHRPSAWRLHGHGRPLSCLSHGTVQRFQLAGGCGMDIDLRQCRRRDRCRFLLPQRAQERIQTKLGQQIRINRSRIKDASDTNTDFDDIEGAIRSGYFLKQGLSNYEDFYYMNILVTVTADTLENLEWRVAEVRRLMISQDMDLRICRFRQEEACSKTHRCGDCQYHPL